MGWWRKRTSQNAGWKMGFDSKDVSERAMKTKREGKNERNAVNKLAVNFCCVNQAFAFWRVVAE